MPKKTHESKAISMRSPSEIAQIALAEVVSRMNGCDPKAFPKLVDSYARISAEVRQLEKQRKQQLAAFTDDELVEHLRTLPDRRREAIVTTIQGASLAGRPLF